MEQPPSTAEGDKTDGCPGRREKGERNNPTTPKKGLFKRRAVKT